MSGGCPGWVLRICYEICKDDRIDKSTYVYPSDKGDITLGVFMKEIEDSGILDNPLLLPAPDIVNFALEEKA